MNLALLLAALLGSPLGRATQFNRWLDSPVGMAATDAQADSVARSLGFRSMLAADSVYTSTLED